MQRENLPACIVLLMYGANPAQQVKYRHRNWEKSRFEKMDFWGLGGTELPALPKSSLPLRELLLLECCLCTIHKFHEPNFWTEAMKKDIKRVLMDAYRRAKKVIAWYFDRLLGGKNRKNNKGLYYPYPNEACIVAFLELFRQARNEVDAEQENTSSDSEETHCLYPKACQQFLDAMIVARGLAEEEDPSSTLAM